MLKTRVVFLPLLSLVLALPAFGMTYKTNYPVPCSEVWGAVRDTLSVPENYTVLESDDTKMTASYNVKHAVHANISGAVLQRTNHVSLVQSGAGCEMQVVSNYSGWEHDDKGDFKKRVDAFLAKPKAPVVSEPAEPTAPSK